MKKGYVLGLLFLSFVCALVISKQVFTFNQVTKKQQAYMSSSYSLEDVPKLMLPVLADSMGRDQKPYHIKMDGNKFRSIVLSQGIESEYGSNGVTFSRDNNRITMRLIGSGEFEPTNVSQNKVEYNRGNITEWYVNSPLGVEQGFTLKTTPGHRNSEGKVLLEVGLKMDEHVTARQAEDKSAINFVNSENQSEIFRYRGLFAYDSSGRELPSEMRLLDSKIEILVDDQEAIYPIVIDPFIEIQKIVASDVPPDALFWQFGGTVHISGNTAIVGAFAADGLRGQAYIFNRDNNTGFWSETQILLGSNVGVGDFFGNCVHIDGDTAIVGATHVIPPATLTQGEAYIFERDPMTNMWTEVDIITGSTAGPLDFYGISCSVEESSGIAMVGANRAFSVEGRVYVYERDMANMWNEVQVLIPSGGMADFQFGFKLNFQGNTAAIGAPGQFGTLVGNRVYIYERDMGGTWIEDDILTGSDTVDTDRFGVDVDFDGNNMVIGASAFNMDQGKAYIFERDSMTNIWSEVAILEADTPIMGEFFGSNVSISGDIAIVTASLLISTEGRVFVYERDGMGIWSEVQEILASDGMSGDSFGVEISLDGHQLIIGAPGVNGAMGDFIGAAYLYGNDVTLDVNIIGAGSGTVTSMPAGIDCGSVVNDCTEDYNYQTLVALTADPDFGSFFVGWSDDCSGIIEDTTILMLDDSICTAEFALIPVTLDVTIEGNGEGGVMSTNPGIDCNSSGAMDCDEIYLFGDVVTLTATALPGSSFTGWSGDDACTGDPLNPILNLTMDMDISCIATFVLDPVTLDVVIQGNGSCRVTSVPDVINCPGDCTETFDPPGVTVDLTVTPDISSLFAGWSGDCSGEDFETSITVNEDSTCIATCVLSNFILNPIYPALDDNINFISAENAYPGGRVAFAWANRTGSFTIGGQACNGTQLGIQNPYLLAIVSANDFGVATHIFYIPFFSDFEFEVQLQAIDVETCRTSNIVPQVIRKDDD